MLSVFAVNSLADVVADDGFITLREALEAANTNTAVYDAPAGSATEADKIIIFAQDPADPAHSRITLSGTQLDILDDVEIYGPGAERLAIDANQQSRVFSVAAEVDALLWGLTIAGGKTTDNGGGIYNLGTLTVDHSTISGNSSVKSWSSGGGGGIYSSGPLIIANSTLSDNSVSGTRYTYGGGIHSTGTLTVTDCTFLGNSAVGVGDNSYESYGGGIYSTGTSTICNCTFSINSATGSNRSFGGAVYNTGTLNVDGSTFQGNSIIGRSQGGGGGISSSGPVTIEDSALVGNSAKGASSALVAGGGICTLSGGDLTVRNCTLSDNSATSAYRADGGGIYASSGMMTVDDSTFSGNSASTLGGGICGSGTINNSTFSNNVADSGGGIRSSILNVSNCEFRGNAAHWGGGIRNEGTLRMDACLLSGNTAISYGGGVFANGTSTIADSTLCGNTSGGSGGGMYQISGTLTMTNSTICANHRGGFGGEGTMMIVGCTIWGNNGGGIEGSALTIIGCTISNNDGSGIYSDGTLTVTNSTISENLADRGGGIYLDDTSSTAMLNNTIVAGNSASSSGSDIYCPWGSVSGSYNLIGDGTGLSALVNGVDGNQVGTSSWPIDPLLSDWTLSENGVWGYYLLPESPALDAGSNTLAVDPVGQPLLEDVWGNARTQNGTVDIGAVEGATAGSPARIYTVTSLAETMASDGVVTLREAIEAANGNQPVGDAPAGSFSERDVIRFAEGLSGTIPVDDGQLEIAGDLSVEGRAAERLTLQASGRNRVFLMRPSAFVSLEGITVSGGLADRGGGIYNSGALVIADCTISGNSAVGSEYTYAGGGGIWNRGTLTVTNSSFFGNSVTGSAVTYGGGICNVSGSLTLTDSIVSGNSASGESSGSGGGIYSSSGTLTVSNSAISGNTGGGIYNSSGTLTVNSSAISGNTGGGICSGGTLAVINSTLSGNSAVYGGGILISGTATVVNSTLTGNSATGNSAHGGGIYVTGSSSILTLNNTIVAGNTASSRPDVYRYSGTLSGFHNLIGDGSGQTAFVHGINGNQVGTSSSPINPKLSAAGGPLPGSPAINTGSNALAVDAAGNPLATDRDGRQRIIYGTVDIGAYEYCVMGDADYSGTVDGGDAAVMAAHWGMTGMGWGDGDFNGDGRVNAVDAAILGANWGATFSPPAEQLPSAPVVPRSPATIVGPMPAVRTKYEGQRTENEIERAKEEPGPTLPPCASASCYVVLVKGQCCDRPGRRNDHTQPAIQSSVIIGGDYFSETPGLDQTP